MTEMLAWLDGRVAPARETAVPVLDHGLLYGDGIFEGLRFYDKRVFRLELHLARLTVGARALGLAIPGGDAGVRAALRSLLAAYGAADGYVRLVITRGTGPLGVDPLTCEAPRMFVIAAPLALFPPERQLAGVSLFTSTFRRPSADALEPRIKSLNYLNNALAKQEARQRGADEALLLNARGLIAEAAAANLFVVRDGVLQTPPTTDGALDGITRRTVLELARELGVPAEERSLGRIDLYAASEVFLTGTGAGLVPVGSLDGRPAGAGSERPVLARLLAAYRERIPAYSVAP